jgi:hypothetical protein
MNPSTLSRKSVYCLAVISAFFCPTIIWADTLNTVGSFDVGNGATLDGISFADEGGTPTLYAANNTAGGSYDGYDVTDGSLLLSLATGTFTQSAAIGSGDTDPEYYFGSDSRTFRSNSASTGFGATIFFAPFDIEGQESVDPYSGYQNFWAIETGTSTIVQLDYAVVQSVQQSFSTIGTNLTDLASDLNGNLYLLGGSSVYEYTTTGTYENTYTLDPTILDPLGIAFDTDTNQLLISNGTSTVYEVATVPEPSTWVFCLMGLSVLGLGLRYRSQRV